MRNQWRFLLRNNLFSVPRTSRSLLLPQVTSSFTTTTTAATVSVSNILPNFKNQSFTPHFHRFYSTDTPVKGKSSETSLVIDIFSKDLSFDDIKKELESNNVDVTSDLVNEVLKHLDSEPGTGIKFFDWVLESDGKGVILDSNSYNLMLGILGGNGYFKEFWSMLDVTKKKGFGVKRDAFVRVLERFEKDGLEGDIEKLKGFFAKKDTPEFLTSKIRRIVRKSVWGESVETELKVLDVKYSSELVKTVLEKLAVEPMKALLFFRWLEESALFKHDQVTYNTMAIVSGREDCVEGFWNVVMDMRKAGYEMETKTYIKILGRFTDRRMMKDAVGLYEFAMKGANKPSHRQDFILLLKKLAVAKDELDMELFSRVVKAYTEKGFKLDDFMLDSVLKSLTSVGRMKECRKVLDALVEAGFSPSGFMQARVAYDLSSSKLKPESDEYMKTLEGHGFTPDYKTWSSLIEGHCVAGDFEKAKHCLEKMVKKEGISCVGYALDTLVYAYCEKYRSAEACRMLTEFVNKHTNVELWHGTYKTLINKLLGQKGFEDALPLLGLMKKHGFPPFVDPFIAHLSKKGSADEVMQFFKAVTEKKYPSTNIYVKLFEAYSKAGRHKEAQNVFEKCPKYIRNNADILNIFCSMKSKEKSGKVKKASGAAA